ncbi:MAG: type II secretion system F family protein [Acidimicrobiia bacterium]
MAALVGALAALGTWYLYSAVALGWRGLRPGPVLAGAGPSKPGRRDWLVQAGLGEVRLGEFAGVMAALFVAGSALGFAVFGGAVPALVVGGFAATAPVGSYHRRRDTRSAVSQEAWPRLIEEIRIQTGSLGRSIPQALFDVGRRGPEEMRGAFSAAHREWLITTDFERTVGVLKARLADPTADATCETLLVAHDLGGSDLDRRLDALVEDRIVDVQGRKDARARQAGARFARRFVLLVPLGMALAGMSIGEGRRAYGTATGQLLVICGLAMVAGCWAWAGRLMRLPQERRVFYE